MRKAKATPSALTLSGAVYECSCGAVHNGVAGQFPLGWSTCLGTTWCPDCTAAGVPAREMKSSREAA